MSPTLGSPTGMRTIRRLDFLLAIYATSKACNRALLHFAHQNLCSGSSDDIITSKSFRYFTEIYKV